jgi:hypothetical protein
MVRKGRDEEKKYPVIARESWQAIIQRWKWRSGREREREREKKGELQVKKWGDILYGGWRSPRCNDIDSKAPY